MVTDYRSRPWRVARTLAFFGVVALSWAATDGLQAAYVGVGGASDDEASVVIRWLVTAAWLLHVSSVVIALGAIVFPPRGNALTRAVARKLLVLALAFYIASAGVHLKNCFVMFSKLFDHARDHPLPLQVQVAMVGFCLVAAAGCSAFVAVSPRCKGTSAAQPRGSDEDSDEDVNSGYGAFASDEERPDRLEVKKKVVV